MVERFTLMMIACIASAAMAKLPAPGQPSFSHQHVGTLAALANDGRLDTWTNHVAASGYQEDCGIGQSGDGVLDNEGCGHSASDQADRLVWVV